MVCLCGLVFKRASERLFAQCLGQVQQKRESGQFKTNSLSLCQLLGFPEWCPIADYGVGFGWPNQEFRSPLQGLYEGNHNHPREESYHARVLCGLSLTWSFKGCKPIIHSLLLVLIVSMKFSFKKLVALFITEHIKVGGPDMQHDFCGSPFARKNSRQRSRLPEAVFVRLILRGRGGGKDVTPSTSLGSGNPSGFSCVPENLINHWTACANLLTRKCSELAPGAAAHDQPACRVLGIKVAVVKLWQKVRRGQPH